MMSQCIWENVFLFIEVSLFSANQFLMAWLQHVNIKCQHLFVVEILDTLNLCNSNEDDMFLYFFPDIYLESISSVNKLNMEIVQPSFQQQNRTQIEQLNRWI